ncbi:hypothetical protein D3C78_1850320 [compost metagenome]
MLVRVIDREGLREILVAIFVEQANNTDCFDVISEIRGITKDAVHVVPSTSFQQDLTRGH